MFSDMGKSLDAAFEKIHQIYLKVEGVDNALGVDPDTKLDRILERVSVPSIQCSWCDFKRNVVAGGHTLDDARAEVRKHEETCTNNPWLAKIKELTTSLESHKTACEQWRLAATSTRTLRVLCVSCGYCSLAVPCPSGDSAESVKEEMRKHISTCEANPFVKRVAELEKSEKRLEKCLSNLGTVNDEMNRAGITLASPLPFDDVTVPLVRKAVEELLALRNVHSRAETTPKTAKESSAPEASEAVTPQWKFISFSKAGAQGGAELLIMEDTAGNTEKFDAQSVGNMSKKLAEEVSRRELAESRIVRLENEATGYRSNIEKWREALEQSVVERQKVEYGMEQLRKAVQQGRQHDVADMVCVPYPSFYLAPVVMFDPEISSKINNAVWQV